MIIPDTSEKDKTEPQGSQSLLKKAFLPIIFILILTLALGSYKLYKTTSSRQPITIEYTHATSTPTVSVATSTPATANSTISSSTTPKILGIYVASRGGTSYYLPTCSGAKRISDKNKIWFQSKEEAERLGYKPAKTCKGL